MIFYSFNTQKRAISLDNFMWPFIINLEALKKNNDIKNYVFLPGTIAATACSPTTITFTAFASKTTEYKLNE